MGGEAPAEPPCTARPYGAILNCYYSVQLFRMAVVYPPLFSMLFALLPNHYCNQNNILIYILVIPCGMVLWLMVLLINFEATTAFTTYIPTTGML